MKITIKKALESDSIIFDSFYNALSQKGIGMWDEVNSTEIIREYISDMMKNEVSVSHILKALEEEVCSTDVWCIWLGNSMETPNPVNTKKELVEALELVDDLETIVEFKV